MSVSNIVIPAFQQSGQSISGTMESQKNFSDLSLSRMTLALKDSDSGMHYVEFQLGQKKVKTSPASAEGTSKMTWEGEHQLSLYADDLQMGKDKVTLTVIYPLLISHFVVVCCNLYVSKSFLPSTAFVILINTCCPSGIGLQTGHTAARPPPGLRCRRCQPQWQSLVYRSTHQQAGHHGWVCQF